jgi:hypothetical protein
MTHKQIIEKELKELFDQIGQFYKNQEIHLSIKSLNQNLQDTIQELKERNEGINETELIPITTEMSNLIQIMRKRLSIKNEEVEKVTQTNDKVKQLILPYWEIYFTETVKQLKYDKEINNQQEEKLFKLVKERNFEKLHDFHQKYFGNEIKTNEQYQKDLKDWLKENDV